MYWWSETDDEILPVFTQFLWNLKIYFLVFACFWCCFRRLFISVVLRKYHKDCNIHVHVHVLKIILVQGFCPLQIEIAWFRNWFRLNFPCSCNWRYQNKEATSDSLHQLNKLHRFIDCLWFRTLRVDWSKVYFLYWPSGTADASHIQTVSITRCYSFPRVWASHERYKWVDQAVWFLSSVYVTHD